MSTLTRPITFFDLHLKTRVGKTIAIITIFLLAIFVNVNAQIEDGYYQGWSSVGESPTFIDVYSCVYECPSESPKVCIKLFNEGSGTQDANLTVTITDQMSGDQVSHQIQNVTLELGETKKPSCGGNVNQNLVFDVPSGFDPYSIIISTSF